MECVVRIVNLFLLAYCLLPVRLPLSVYLLLFLHLAPAKHMDQKHWLAVPLDGSVSDSKVLDLLDMSYDLVDGARWYISM